MLEKTSRTYLFIQSKFKFCLFFVYALFCLSISVLPIQAQQTMALSDPSNILYRSLGKENLPVFNGIRFYDLFKSDTDNFRYFKKYKPFITSITYNGQAYDNILTRYDLLTDHLIVYTEGKLSFFQVQLANERVNAFQIDGLSFERLDLSCTHKVDKNAFYEVAYAGLDLHLYIAWSKAEKLKTRVENPFYTFKIDKEYYLKMGAEYLTVDSMKDILRIFPERKKEIKEFYKAYRQNKKEDSKQFMQKLAFYLDQDKKN